VHLAALRQQYEKDPYFYKTSMVSYDHEPIFATGSMLGISDVPGMLLLMDEIEVQGLDVMSAGVALAWATEAQQSGLISTEETDGLQLEFGCSERYIQAVKRIVRQPTGFYRALARGAAHASSIYGGAEFALTFGKNEMAGYHTGPGCHLGYLTGARHSHLDSAGYSIDQKAAQKGETLEPGKTADALLKEERWRQVLSSLVVCMFARGIYSEEAVLKTLALTGVQYSAEQLAQFGAETLRLKNEFKRREGFDFSALEIPDRIFKTLSPLGQIDETFMRQAIARFAEQV
jgi:aldehyde:ferredoxin oxidoreductase